MNPVSKRRAAQLREYRRLRHDFLEPADGRIVLCGVCEHEVATEIHHKIGRSNNRLLQVEHWLAVCPDCHRHLTDHPKWAREHGYSGDRLAR